jgi:hypothetical protein
VRLLAVCENCDSVFQIKSDNRGKTVFDSNIDVRLEISWDIANTSDLEEMDDISDSDVDVDNIKVKFQCSNCLDDYLIIET